MKPAAYDRTPVHLPGLEATQGPNARPPVYVPLNHIEMPPYKDDDDGWTKVTYKRKVWRGNRRGKKEQKQYTV